MTAAVRAGHAPSRACYLRGCPEAACRERHLRYCKEYDLRRHREGRRRIDADEAAAHLRALIADGWTQNGIEIATGIPRHTICGLASGTHTEVFRETADIILAFRPGENTECPGHWMDTTGTIRRVRALAAIGYPTYTVADAVGIGHATMRHLVAGNREKVAKSTARKIAELYPRWIAKPGPSATTRGIAKSRGWHGPLAWGGNIDDPAAQPDTEGAGYDDTPRKRDDLRTEEIKHLAGFGLSDYEIAKLVRLPVGDVKTRIGKIRAEKAAKAAKRVAA